MHKMSMRPSSTFCRCCRRLMLSPLMFSFVNDNNDNNDIRLRQNMHFVYCGRPYRNSLVDTFLTLPERRAMAWRVFFDNEYTNGRPYPASALANIRVRKQVFSSKISIRILLRYNGTLCWLSRSFSFWYSIKSKWTFSFNIRIECWIEHDDGPE